METTMSINDMERYKEMIREAVMNSLSDAYLTLLIQGIYQLGKLDAIKEMREGLK